MLTLATVPVWLPALALAALGVRLADGAPVLFRDSRAGRGGRPFTLFKLRTMRAGAESDAARLTRFGRFLRSTSLDELPQLWNVLRGDMSLVGPRPLPVRYLPRYTREQNRRHEVRPGLTGWAQVNGRNALDWPEKLRLDVEYVERRSLAFDAKILLKTIARVFCRRGISHPGEATMCEFQGAGGQTDFSNQKERSHRHGLPEKRGSR